MKRRYGLLGLLSLVGVLGMITGNASLYPFFAFVLFFQYLFVKADEMFIENMRKAAAWAFYTGLASTTAITCLSMMVQQRSEIALLKGASAGFGISLIVFSSVSAWFDWKDRRGISYD